jgi:putative DNA primase/helicase
MTNDRDDMRLFLRECFANNTGKLCANIGVNPFRDSAGSYRHHSFPPYSVGYPDATATAINHFVSQRKHRDVYVATGLSYQGARELGSLKACSVLHADWDGDPALTDNVLAKLREIHGWAIGSGTPGHLHCFVSLAEPLVIAADVSRWCVAFQQFLPPGSDSKIAWNDVLRLPGTFSHKSRIDGGEPTPVQFVIRPDGMRWDLSALATTLGVTLETTSESSSTSSGRPTTTAHSGGDPHEVEPVDDIPASVTEALDNPKIKADGKTLDRSETIFKVVRACYDAGLTLPQTRFVVRSRPELATKLDEQPNRDDVGVSWAKVEENCRERLEHLRKEQAIDAELLKRHPLTGRTTMNNNTEAGGTTQARTIEHSAHLAMAIKFADQAAGRHLYVHGIGWHHWDGKRWAQDESGHTERELHELFRREWIAAYLIENETIRKAKVQWISSCERASGIEGVLKVASTLSTFATTVGDLDPDPYLLNVANGTLDLRTMDLRPHDPADRITKVTRGAYDPENPAAGNTFATFLDKVLPKPGVREYLQRLSGVALLGTVIEHSLPILTGVGGNGKGTFYKALKFALGDYADMADPELFSEHRRDSSSPSTGEMALRGLRLVIVSESNRDKTLDEARMKRLTGGDTITARHLYQKRAVSFEPSHLPLYITNHLPKVSGDDAVWRRLRVLPFDVVIDDNEKDGHLGEKLELEADAVLAWAIKGWMDYQSRGGALAEPDDVLVATRNYRAESDDVARFINDWCITGSPVNKALTNVLFAAYNRWRENEGGEELSAKAFGQELTRNGYLAPEEERTRKGRWRVGIALHPDHKA